MCKGTLGLVLMCQEYNKQHYSRVYGASLPLLPSQKPYPTPRALRLITVVYLEFIFKQGGAG